jgi:nucleoside phosphorylase
MTNLHNPKARFGLTLREATESTFQPAIADSPPLPVVNFASVDKDAPTLLSTPAGKLPEASAIIITWASAEWAALQHVFCSSVSPMPYNKRSESTWSGWEKYSSNIPSGAPSGWDFWGSYRLVEISGQNVLLFKSNTHLDWPGAKYLVALVQLLVRESKPNVILSIGTAGGAKPQDHIGTVRAVSAGTLFEAGQSQRNWPVYKNSWNASTAIITSGGFKNLLLPVPTKAADLRALSAQFNQHYGTDYSLSQLDPNGLNLADPTPKIDVQTGGVASLLTTSSFVVGTTAGNYQDYTSIEMDDAVVGEACAASGTSFGFVRNLSDPVQNVALPPTVQGNWGSAVYDAYGFYTSYNGAVATWAMLAY